jgi:urate oxidase / 2-oxo-4-hydroxy-4-carboxy-5-ureidoimidazoline decarboxylase
VADPVAQLYGKHAVSVYRIAGDRLFACEVDTMLIGRAFVPSYTEGDNSMVVATDSMKNFVHRTALEFDGDALEDFLFELGSRFLARYEHVDSVDMQGEEVTFGKKDGVLFQRLYDDRAVASVAVGRAGQRYEWSGRKGLHLIKFSGSSFAGFVRDEYTTLPDTYDRPLFIHLDLDWINSDPTRRAPGEKVRELVVETFAEFESASIQHLVHEMGVRALERFDEIGSISFRAENRLWDKAAEGEGAVVYTEARPPFGVIELTLQR